MKRKPARQRRRGPPKVRPLPKYGSARRLDGAELELWHERMDRLVMGKRRWYWGTL